MPDEGLRDVAQADAPDDPEIDIGGEAGSPDLPGAEDTGAGEADTFVVGPPCTEADEEPCTISNEHGSCAGEILCHGERGLAPCDAKTPADEVCNAADDDCDGETDEGLPLCDCGDGTCAADGGETADLCPCDCRECGDGICSPCGESPAACPEDCCRTPLGPSECGDGYCLGYGCGENPADCPGDCGKDCGNGECERGENPYGCPEDCKRGECGNAVCEPTDGGPLLCPADCTPDCGNCSCDQGESWVDCPIDCGFCGDGACSECPNFDESEETCPLDCCVPVAETDATCDGKDDDCDGAVDEEACDDGDPCTLDLCGTDATCTHPKAEGLCGASATADPQAETRVEDPVGGVIVVVPAGAVEEPVEIAVEPLPEHEGAPVEGEPEGVVVRSVWSFEPHGQTFHPPVQITLPVRGEPLLGRSFVRVLVLDEEEGVWRQATMLDGSEVFARASEDGLSLAYEIDHFSKHGFARPLPDCEPKCFQNDCGPDGCGSVCGLCPEDAVCVENKCWNPAPELCNGFDDDFDGETDEDPCSDGNPCTTDDICDAGFCLGTPIDCFDEEPCTDDSCDRSTGECVHEPLSGPCDDGDPCTTGDACDGGACTGTAVDCDDMNPCTDDSCSGSGECEHAANQGMCTDDDPCTDSDKCDGGACAGTPKACDDDNPCTDDRCDPETGECAHEHNTEPCEDGNLCTTADHCDAGVCAGNAKDCNDDNPCTDDRCDRETGECAHDYNTEPCKDGDLCTTADHCDMGACVGTAVDCDDDNECTADSCDGSTGLCLNEALGGPCDDGDPCTEVDACDGTVCAGVPVVCEDGNDCTEDSCDGSSGECQHTPKAGPCDDQDACTGQDACDGGVCKGTPRICNDFNGCTDDTCDPLEGCVHTDNTAPCNDGDGCTQTDICSEGDCVGSDPVVCEALDQCHLPGVCEQATGVCTTPAKTDGEPCEDGDLCTEEDQCTAGACEPGSEKICDDGNDCTADSCDPGEGCVFENNQQASTVCTGNMLMWADCYGAATTMVMDCGVCGCADGQCLTGADGAAKCDDGDPCTEDTCTNPVGCVHKTIESPACGASCAPKLVLESTGRPLVGRQEGEALAFGGSFAYVGTELGIDVYDAGDDDAISPVGRMDTPNAVKGIATANGLVYALLVSQTGGGAALGIYDLSTPGAFTEKSRTPVSPGTPRALVVSGDRAYVVGDRMALRVYDVTDPTKEATVVGALGGTESYTDIAATGKHLVIAGRDYGAVALIGCTMGDSPEETFSQTGFGARFVNTQGNLAVTDKTSGGIITLAVSPSTGNAIWRPVIGSSFNPNDAHFAGDLVVMSVPDETTSTAHVYGIANPDQPIYYGGTRFPGTQATLGSSGGAFWAAGKGLRSFDLADPTKPAVKDAYDLAGSANALRARDGYVYVADGNAGLRVVDVSDPSAPAHAGHVSTGGDTKDLALAGDRAYLVGTQRGLMVVDISTPTSPALVDFDDSSAQDATAIEVASGMAYAAGPNSLRIFDLADPDQPAARGSVSLMGGGQFDIRVVGGTAYVATGYSDVGIVDVSDPDAPSTSGSIMDHETYPDSLDVVGTTLYLLSGMGNQIWDASNPQQPSALGRMWTSYTNQSGSGISGTALKVLHDRAYVTGGTLGFAVVDVTHPSTTEVLDDLVPGSVTQPSAIDVEADRAYLGGGFLGPVEVVRIDCSTP